MIITYIIHNQSGIPGDKIVTVRGKIAHMVLEYKNKQDKIGITIIKIEEN